MDRLIVEVDATFPLETGGVLMGYVHGGDCIVTAIVGPGPNAVHHECTFTPDYEYQEMEVANIYVSSGRRWTYLGDWHSHPRQRMPSLSPKDIRTLKCIARYKGARIAQPIMLLLAGEPDDWSLNVWQWKPSKLMWWKSDVTLLNVRTC